MVQTLSERLFDDAARSGIDPFAVFDEWFALAEAREPNDPHAMALASVDAAGLPDVRMVLLNGHDREGFVFFTNFESVKAEHLLVNPQAAMVMHWKSLRRQVRMRGPVEIVSNAQADTYFASRPRGSQIASAASRQSRPLSSRRELAEQVAALTAEIGAGPVPRPPHWSGFCLKPASIEFWQDGEFRLHDRVRFTRPAPEAPWASQRLYP